jgi:hypothetical protein
VPARWPEVSRLLRVGGAVALLILMFATSWYGLSTPARASFGAAHSTATHVWSMLSIVRWWLLLAVAGALASVVIDHRGMADAAAVFGLIATGALFYRLLVVLPDPDAVLDVKLGGYLALLACAALTLGAYEAEAGPGRAEGSDGSAVPDSRPPVAPIE